MFPKLISASSLYLLYNETIKERNVELEGGKQFMSVGKNIGKVFRVNMFVEVLVAVSRVVLPKLRQVDDPEHWEGRQKEMLKILFEYMETVKSREKQSKFKDCRFSFIVLEEYG